MFLASVVIIAQLYSCGTYSAGNYGQCPVSASQTAPAVTQSSTPSSTGATPATPTPDPRPTPLQRSASSSFAQLAADFVRVDYVTLLIGSFILVVLAATAMTFIVRRNDIRPHNKPPSVNS